MAPSILIADPDGLHADGLKSRLSEAGFAVTSLKDADAALAKARTHPPELVILADELGDASGFSVCNRLRRVPGLAAVPVFILVAPGNTGAAEAHRSSRTPASEYLSRPVETYALFEAVQRLFPETTLPDRTFVGPLPTIPPPAPPPAKPPPLKQREAKPPAPAAEASSAAVLAELREVVKRQGELEAELAEAREQAAREKDRADQADGTLEALTRDLQNAAAALAEHQQAAAERQKVLEQTAEDLDDLARSLEDARAEAKELRASLLHAESDGAAARARADEAAQKFDDAAGRLAESEALAEAVRRERDEASEARNAAEQELEEIRRTLETRERELAAARAEAGRLAALETELSEARVHLAEEEHQRSELARRCDRLEEDVQVQAALSDEWRARFEELEVKLAGAEKAREVVRSQADGVAVAKAEAQKQISAAQKQRDEAVAALEALRSQRGGGASDELEQAKRDIASLKKKLVHAESALEAAAQLRAKVGKLEKALKEARGPGKG